MLSLLKKCGELYPQPFSLGKWKQNKDTLIYVNRFFCDLVKYEEKEILNRSCHFLQGPLTDSQSTLRIKKAIIAREPICEDILNYKKDGSLFLNRLVLLPIKIKLDFYYIGLQHEMTQEVLKQNLKKIQISPAEVADWVKNRLNSVILILDLARTHSTPDVIAKVDSTLKKISDFVAGLNP